MAIAERFGSDPYSVRYVWPAALVDRAMVRLQAESAHTSKRATRKKHESAMGRAMASLGVRDGR